MDAIVLHAGRELCVIPPTVASELIRRLRSFSESPVDPAATLAAVLEHVLTKEAHSGRELRLEPAEAADLLDTLNEWGDERGDLADSLECIRNGLMREAGMI